MTIPDETGRRWIDINKISNEIDSQWKKIRIQFTMEHQHLFDQVKENKNEAGKIIKLFFDKVYRPFFNKYKNEIKRQLINIEYFKKNQIAQVVLTDYQVKQVLFYYNNDELNLEKKNQIKNNLKYITPMLKKYKIPYTFRKQYSKCDRYFNL